MPNNEMDINQLITTIKAGANDITLYPGAEMSLIKKFETLMGFKLPSELKIFYQLCNGFESEDYLFRLVPLDEVLDTIEYGKLENRSSHLKSNQFYLAEYLIYSDMWTIEVGSEQSGSYLMFYLNNEGKRIELTHSLTEFIGNFLAGGIFGKNGLYQWSGVV